MKVLNINNETISKLELMVNLLHSRKLPIILSYKAILIYGVLFTKFDKVKPQLMTNKSSYHAWSSIFKLISFTMAKNAGPSLER